MSRFSSLCLVALLAVLLFATTTYAQDYSIECRYTYRTATSPDTYDDSVVFTPCSTDSSYQLPVLECSTKDNNDKYAPVFQMRCVSNVQGEDATVVDFDQCQNAASQISSAITDRFPVPTAGSMTSFPYSCNEPLAHQYLCDNNVCSAATISTGCSINRVITCGIKSWTSSATDTTFSYLTAAKLEECAAAPDGALTQAEKAAIFDPSMVDAPRYTSNTADACDNKVILCAAGQNAAVASLAQCKPSGSFTPVTPYESTGLCQQRVEQAYYCVGSIKLVSGTTTTPTLLAMSNCAGVIDQTIPAIVSAPQSQTIINGVVVQESATVPGCTISYALKATKLANPETIPASDFTHDISIADYESLSTYFTSDNACAVSTPLSPTEHFTRFIVCQKFDSEGTYELAPLNECANVQVDLPEVQRLTIVSSTELVIVDTYEQLCGTIAYTYEEFTAPTQADSSVTLNTAPVLQPLTVQQYLAITDEQTGFKCAKDFHYSTICLRSVNGVNLAVPFSHCNTATGLSTKYKEGQLYDGLQCENKCLKPSTTLPTNAAYRTALTTQQVNTLFATSCLDAWTEVPMTTCNQPSSKTRTEVCLISYLDANQQTAAVWSAVSDCSLSHSGDNNLSANNLQVGTISHECTYECLTTSDTKVACDSPVIDPFRVSENEQCVDTYQQKVQCTITGDAGIAYTLPLNQCNMASVTMPILVEQYNQLEFSTIVNTATSYTNIFSVDTPTCQKSFAAYCAPQHVTGFDAEGTTVDIVNKVWPCNAAPAVESYTNSSIEVQWKMIQPENISCNTISQVAPVAARVKYCLEVRKDTVQDITHYFVSQSTECQNVLNPYDVEHTAPCERNLVCYNAEGAVEDCATAVQNSKPTACTNMATWSVGCQIAYFPYPTDDALTTTRTLDKCSGSTVPTALTPQQSAQQQFNDLQAKDTIQKWDYKHTTSDEGCVFEWRCASDYSSQQFADYKSCSEPEFVEKLCTRCTDAKTDQIAARCIATTANTDGTIEKMELPAGALCSNVPAPIIQCGCEQVCAPYGSTEWTTCSDEQFTKPTQCSGIAQRAVGLKLKDNTIQTSCSGVVSRSICGSYTLPEATKMIVAEDVEQYCSAILSTKCAPVGTTNTNGFESCDNDYGYNSCTAQNCGLDGGLERIVGCFIANKTITDYISDTMGWAKQSEIDFYTTLLNNLCNAAIPTVPTTKLCDCEVDYWCSAQENPQNVDDFAQCNSTIGFPPSSQVTCINDDRVVDRVVYCRQTNGTFVSIDHKTEVYGCDEDKLPTITQTYNGTIPCGGEFFCSDDLTTTTPYTHGIIASENICNTTNYYSDICYQQDPQDITGFVENRCIIPDLQTETLYRRRTVQCLLFFDHEDRDIDEYPTFPAYFSAPANYEAFCKKLATIDGDDIPSSAAAQGDFDGEIEMCIDQEGCTPQIYDFATQGTLFTEGSTGNFTWSYIGPKSSSVVVTFEYAVATATSPTSPSLIWSPAIHPSTAPKATALTYTWSIPLIPRTLPMPIFLLRAKIANQQGAEYVYATKPVTIQLVDTCATTTCTGLNLQNSTCALSSEGEPECQCIAPQNPGAVFSQPTSTKPCERLSTCDALSATTCQNNGYLTFTAGENLSNQECATKCTCPGGQTSDNCSSDSCPVELKCNTQHGRTPASGMCACQQCYRGFGGPSCNDCVKYAQIVITNPQQDFVQVFTEPSMGSQVAASLQKTKLLTWVAQVVAQYPAEYITLEPAGTGVTTIQGMQVFSVVFAFRGQCPQVSPAAFTLTANTPQLDTLSFAMLFAAANADTQVFGPMKTAQSTMMTLEGEAVQMPAEVIDCKVDIAHPACQKTDDPKKDDDSNVGVIVGVIVGVVGGVFIIIILIVVLFKCGCVGGEGGSSSGSSAGASSSSSVPKRKQTRLQQTEADANAAALELI